MKIIIIAAVANNNIIGKDGKLPWNIKEEMEFFRNTTLGYPVLMGYNTFLSLNKPLAQRLNLVITSKNFLKNTNNVIYFNIIKNAIDYAKELKFKNLFIIGGESIFKQTIFLADEMIISKIKKDYIGDTKFPEIEKTTWLKIKEETRDNFNIEYYKKNL